MQSNWITTKRKGYIGLMRGLMALSTALTCGIALFLIGYVLIKGLPSITWELLSTKPSYLAGTIGILPDILNTVYIIVATLLIVLPLGVGAAIYLTEYASSQRLVTVIEYAAETLSGIPSIIFGLVGMLIFANSFGSCLLAGALTLVIMNLPTVMRTAQESLKTVPQSYREGAFGLGAGKWRILSAGRILGESAALLFTAGFAHVLNGFLSGLGSPGATLTVALYLYTKEPGPGGAQASFAIAAILMALTLTINFAAVLVGRIFKKRRAL